MCTMLLTKEFIQKLIDHYSVNSQAHMELGHMERAQYFLGKASAYLDMYHMLFPEMEKERAYPLDIEKRRSEIESTKKIYLKYNIG